MLIRSKLAPPHRALDLLCRAHLVDRVMTASKPLTIINAPAGYGKTALLAQCHSRWSAQDVLVGWYSADDGQFEGEQFFAYLMAALYHAGLPLPYSREAIDAGLPGLALDAAAHAVVAALEASEEPIRLIIDDYHRIASSKTNRFLDYVVQRMPSHAGIILASRGGVELSLAALRVQGELLQLDQNDLRFSRDEIGAFLKRESTKVEAEALIERTEGWPAVLQLLRLWLQGRDQPVDLTDLTRKSSDLADYLAEQVVTGLAADVREFMMMTSLVDRICAPLADAITGQADGGRMLAEIQRLNLLMTPLDDTSMWFRYHPLLTEFFRNIIAGHDRPIVEAIRYKAANWFADAGLIADALEQAARISDGYAVLRIMERSGGWLLALRGGLPILRYLENDVLFDPVEYPRVALAEAYLAAQEGRLLEARAALNKLISVLPIEVALMNDASLAFEIIANDIVIRIYEDQRIPTRYSELIECELSKRDCGVTLRAMLTHMLSLYCLDQGDDVWCRAHGEKARKLARTENLPLVETYAFQYVGLSHLRCGHRREAELLFRRGLEHATRSFGEASAQVAVAGVLLAYSLYLAGDLSTAAEMLDAALPVVETSDGWHDIFVAAYVTQIGVATRMGDYAAAERALARGRDVADARNLKRLQYQLEIIHVRLLLFAGRNETAELLLQQLGPPIEEFQVRDPKLGCDYKVCMILVVLACSHTASHTAHDELSSLANQIGDLQSLELDIELLVIRSMLSALEGRRKESAILFRRALDAADSEGLIAPISQFGAQLSISLDACVESMHLFEPSQRKMVSRLSQNVSHLVGTAIGLPKAGDSIVTPREVDVLQALSDGLSSKEIARRLGVAESTVKTHRINIYRKLNATTRSKVISAAKKMAII